MAVEIDPAVPFLDVADQAPSVRSAQVRRARQASQSGPRSPLRASPASAAKYSAWARRAVPEAQEQITDARYRFEFVSRQINAYGR